MSVIFHQDGLVQNFDTNLCVEENNEFWRNFKVKFSLGFWPVIISNFGPGEPKQFARINRVSPRNALTGRPRKFRGCFSIAARQSFRNIWNNGPGHSRSPSGVPLGLRGTYGSIFALRVPFWVLFGVCLWVSLGVPAGLSFEVSFDMGGRAWRVNNFQSSYINNTLIEFDKDEIECHLNLCLRPASRSQAKV